jgi:tetratricopeptide (TPR) repeat protein
MLLFLGYVEFYPISWALGTTFISLSLKHLTGHGSLWPVLCAVLAAVAAHVQAVFLLGGLMFFLVRGVPSRRVRLSLHACLAICAVIGVASLIWLAKTRIEFQVLFLPLIQGRPVAPDYTMLSVSHLFDLSQLLLLVYPGTAVLVAARLLPPLRLKKDSISSYLALLSVGSLAFLLTYGAAITMARDWDIMSLALLPPVCWLLHQIDSKKSTVDARQAFSYFTLCAAVVGSLLIVESRAESAADRFQSVLNTRDRSSWTILVNYLQEKGDKARAYALRAEMNRAFPDYRDLERAHALLDAGDVRGGVGIARQLVSRDPFNPDFLQVAAEAYVKAGQYEQAELFFRDAVRLRPYLPPIRNELGQVYLKQGRYAEALAELKAARRQDPTMTAITEGIGLAYVYLGQLDSASSVADTLYMADPHSPGGHALSLVIALNRGDQSAARAHFVEYLKYGEGRSDYANMKEYYSYLLK